MAPTPAKPEPKVEPEPKIVEPNGDAYGDLCTGLDIIVRAMRDAKVSEVMIIGESITLKRTVMRPVEETDEWEAGAREVQ